MPTHFQGSRTEILALDLYIKLVRCTDSLTSRLHCHLDSARLTVSQFGVLEAVHHLGPLHLSVIAQKLLKTGGNLTLVVRNLEKRGLVKRKQDPSDHRFFTVRLTSKGKGLIERVFARHLEGLVAAVGVLQPHEQEEFAAFCKKLGKGASPVRS